MQDKASKKTRIAEFDFLKTLALLLVVVVHSDLHFVFPEVILPIMWFLVSSFFFISGFLAYNSFYSYGASILSFVKTKFWLLYIPFLLASIFYFMLQILLGMTDLNLMYFFSHIAMFNIFDALNTIHNWDFLWFIPYLLLFMIIFCVAEKYLKNWKLQLLAVISVWLFTLLAWGDYHELRLGLVFSQYFLVFMAGVWINKFKLYEKATNFKTALAAIPFVVLFSVDISGMFTSGGILETMRYLLYYNGRSIVLSLGVIFVVLFVFRKLGVSRNRFVEAIAKTSIVIYLMEPFLSYMIRMYVLTEPFQIYMTRIYVFEQPAIYLADGAIFYIYQLLRAGTLFVVLPLAVSLIKKRETMKTVEPQNLHMSN